MMANAKLMRCFTFPCLLVIGMELAVPLARAVDAPSGKIFDVHEFGAKGNGQTLDTVAIQKALDACGTAGGGTVRFPAGTYLSKPITLRTRTTVQLDAGATLQATGDQSAFLKSGTNWLAAQSGSDFVPFIGGKNLEDVTITGRGTIDGAGTNWWGPAEDARRKTPGYTLPRPDLVVITRCKNLRVENITLQNSPRFHLKPIDCDGVVISNVTVLAPSGAANTDAIDPSICRNVLITCCRVDVGDDNVAINSSAKVPGREFGSENITITDCVFLHGHGVSIGGGTAGGIHRVAVRNCTFENTDNGIRIKSQRGSGGVVEDITYSDLTMKNVNPAITFSCYYPRLSAPKGDTAQPFANGTPVFRHIRITNLTATCQKSAGVILGLPESPITDVVLDNVHISSATQGFTVQNARGIQFNNVTVTPGKGPPFIVTNAEVTRD
ncbi:MAG TPA: glycoside hydrolase family 28 protein [Verrucomicrobiae bacterium]|nr:glycoside hydrolase family 28 protein [Verrucomicrobiae bacterium]